MATTQFETRYGFPRASVTLDNWRTRPSSTWSFQNVAEVVPTAAISTYTNGEDQIERPELLGAKSGVGGETVAAFLRRSSTDALAVMKDGAFVWDWFAPTMEPGAPHLVFSIGKSLTAVVAGTLQDEGRLDPTLPVTHYVPEAAGSAYGDCTVQNVLDMRVSLDFTETYLDPQSAFARYRRATLWNPGPRDETLLQFLLSLKKGQGPHGGPFDYLSPNSDMLGVIAERASGERYPDLLRARLWSAIGGQGRCTATVDAEGTARTAGGISITARDLVRVGEMMRNGGMAGSRAVVSEHWVRDTTAGGDRDAWKAGSFPHLMENGSYRNKWYQTGFDSGAFCAIGIHGQWLYVDPAAKVVIVKQSSQNEPVDDPLDRQCLDFFRRLAAMV